MPRRNHAKGRRPQARRGHTSFAPDQEYRGTFVNGLPQRPPRPKLLPMVPSSGTCPTGKIRYGSSTDAQEALRRAIVNREILQSEIVEDRWYPAPGDRACECGGFHLTSSPRRKPQGQR